MKIAIVAFSCFIGVALSFLLESHSSAETCEGRCGNSLDSAKPCQCNDACERFGDCCSDYKAVCFTEATCEGRCGGSLDNTQPCQCNDACEGFGDCCSDYESVCGRDSQSFTDAELLVMGDLLWSADIHRFTDDQLTLDIGGKTDSSSSADEAPNKLFQYVNRAQLSLPSYTLFIDLLDNYNSFTKQPEPSLSVQEQEEVDAFLNHTIKTPVMERLCAALLSKDQIVNEADFRALLVRLWFEFYARSSSSTAPIDSSGFEHVFVGEFKTSTVTGFHSWVQMYLLEESGALNYRGYNGIAEPDLMENNFLWNGLVKKRGSMFIGTSPEFDMAIYTLCMVARPGSQCKTNVNGSTLHILTYDVSHKPGLQVASAFPSLSGV